MSKLRKRFITITSLLIVVGLVATIAINAVANYWEKPLSEYLGVINEGVSGGSDDGDFTSEYANENDLLKAQEELALSITGEGAVLLENNDALPLAKDSNVSLFGISSVGGAVSGSGSGSSDKETKSLRSSLESSNLNINETLFDFYVNSGHSNGAGTPPGDGSAQGDWKIDEVPQSEFTDEVKNTYDSYNDAAIVTFSRQGGEGGDLPREMSRFGGSAEDHYLQLSQEEKDLLRSIKNSGKFSKTIVLVNSHGAMELGFLDEEEYGVNACIWYSGAGNNGIDAIGKIMVGDINPSGKLVDTYAYDNLSSPAMQNFGDFRYVDENGELTGESYVNYSEGIYVGYRYYETRYEDSVLGRANTGDYNYTSTVKYPFGYGLSYTNFEYSDFNLTQEDDHFTATVTVTNIGNVPGKEAVQLYAQSPYTEGGMEKSAVNLINYVKTKELEPQKSETITFEFSKDDLISYDSINEKSYVLDSGTYYVSVGRNAHDAVNNILSKKGFTTQNGMDSEGNADFASEFIQNELVKYSSSSSDIEVTNKFDDAIAIDGTYLSRSNWAVMDNDGLTYATGTKADVSNVTDMSGTVQTRVADSSLLSKLREFGATASTVPSIESEKYNEASKYTYDNDNGLELADMKGLDYDDPKWEQLLDQMKLSEMHILFNKSGYGTSDIESINKPKTFEYDGPAGISNFVTGASSFSYPSSLTTAATWNQDLAASMGNLVGEDGIATKTSGWYAPAVNIHRTPFSGRNFEYYSEDPLLSGVVSSKVIDSVQKKGVYVYVKHFALNDQETNRASYGSLATWANEQSIREIYLKPFQISVEKGAAKGIMTSLNRIGTIPATLSYPLITEVLRNEWGFEGIVITDYLSGKSGDFADQYLLAGGDMFLSTSANELTDAKQNWSRVELRRAAKNILYVQANSLAMNGFGNGATYSAGMPIFRIILIVLDILVALGSSFAGFNVFKAVKMTNEDFETKRIKSKKRRLIIWSVVGITTVILIIIFCIIFLPVIQEALLM